MPRAQDALARFRILATCNGTCDLEHIPSTSFSPDIALHVLPTPGGRSILDWILVLEDE